jgi:hypothetical protein
MSNKDQVLLENAYLQVLEAKMCKCKCDCEACKQKKCKDCKHKNCDCDCECCECKKEKTVTEEGLENSVVKAKVIRKVDTDEFVVKVYVNGKYDEEASYYTNDKQDAFATKQSILNRYKEHGYMVEESAKKVNPYAVEKSIEKKTGKTFGKKHKEEIIKGIKKSAKKSGKTITSDKVKPSKK